MVEQTDYNDEISLTDVFAKLWRRRGLIVILPILSGVFSVAIVLFMATQAYTPIVHYVNLTSIEKGSYPNGVAFSPKDMTAPEVLNALASRINFENSNALFGAITVVNDAPTVAGIIKKYNDQLSQRGLNTTEIDAINAALNEELSRATEKTAKIIVDYQSLGLSEDVGKQLATLLPVVWAEVFTTKFRVLDSTMLSGSSLVKTLNLRSATDALEANDHVDRMLYSLKALKYDNRLAGLQTSGGATPADLFVRVENFERLFLIPILARNLGSLDEQTKFYRVDLALRVQQIAELITGIDEAINSIQIIISGTQTSVSAGQTIDESRTQITGDAIGDIVKLVNKSSLAEYLTEMYEKKSLLIEERSELTLRMKKIGEKFNYDGQFLVSANNRLNSLNNEYTELLNRARLTNRANNATLSRALGSPHRISSMIPKRGILIIILSVVIGGFIAAALALVAPSKSKI